MVLTRRNNGRDLTWEEQMITSIGLQDRIVKTILNMLTIGFRKNINQHLNNPKLIFSLLALNDS